MARTSKSPPVSAKRTVGPASVSPTSVRKSPGASNHAILQAEPIIGRPDDPLEREADRAADTVMAGLRPPPPSAAANLAQRQPLEDEEEEEIQAKAGPDGPRADGAASHGAAGAASAVADGGRPLGAGERSYFEPRFGRDFSDVRIHTGSRAAAAAALIHARAYTLGPDIAFAAGEFAPGTAEGRGLIAHELAHTMQQAPGGARQIQRAIDEADIPTTPVEDIMSDETYFERGIKAIEFYGAEVAILRYDDGAEIRLGLVPGEIEPPFEGVDYRTPATSHMARKPLGAAGLGTGKLDFIPKGNDLMTSTPGMTFGDIPGVFEAIGRTVEFHVHGPSGRIVPTEVNALTAPRLSAVLHEAEAEYIRRFDAMSEGNIEILEKLDLIILLASVYGALAAGATKALAGRGAATAAGKIAARAQSRLVKLFMKLLRKGGTASIKVEGVAMGDVGVTMQGTELFVSRGAIQNVSRIAGRGRLIHSAFEQAAIQAAKKAGASSARVGMHTVVNTGWKAYLESVGYSWQVIQMGTNSFTGFMTKVFTL